MMKKMYMFAMCMGTPKSEAKVSTFNKLFVGYFFSTEKYICKNLDFWCYTEDYIEWDSLHNFFDQWDMPSSYDIRGLQKEGKIVG